MLCWSLSTKYPLLLVWFACQYTVFTQMIPPTIFTFQNNTCTQHVSMHNCKATLSENDLVKNLSFISENTVSLMCTHCKFHEQQNYY